MRVLVADDDSSSRHLLQVSLSRWGYETQAVGNGTEAWEVLSGQDAPPLAVLNWVMPVVDGVELCRRARRKRASHPTYIILLTAKAKKSDVVEGLGAGADDYVSKPFDAGELRARLRVGERIVDLQWELTHRVAELEQALSQVQILRGLLPICAFCKKIRDDHEYWHEVESYVSEHSEAEFTHSICPSCYGRYISRASEGPDTAS